jgi:hypothetical protein
LRGSPKTIFRGFEPDAQAAAMNVEREMALAKIRFGLVRFGNSKALPVLADAGKDDGTIRAFWSSQQRKNSLP